MLSEVMIRPRRMFQAPILVLFVLVSWSVPGHAESRTRACVLFDVAQLAPCRTLDSRELMARGLTATPGDTLVEATFDVSTLLRFGVTRDVRQLLFVIESPTQSLFVVDYLPQTELTTHFAGEIERTQSEDKSHNAGWNASLNPHQLAMAQASISNGNSANESSSYRLLPPQQLLASSGTIARGTAVFFKFIDSPQTTLDGKRQLTVVFRVPAAWRGDYVTLRCAAYSHRSKPTSVDKQICGSADFLIPLYLEGDAAARDAAYELAQRDLQLRRVASRLTEATSDGSTSFTHAVASLFGKGKPRLPKNWLRQVVASSPEQQSFVFEAAMPRDAKHATSAFMAARRQLLSPQRDSHSIANQPWKAAEGRVPKQRDEARPAKSAGHPVRKLAIVER